MTETLEPIHTIPLGPTLTGEVAQAELQFAVENGKPVLYAAVPVWNATWGRWFMWHAPKIMVGVWLVVLIVLVRRMLHVRRTPREAGRRYCRKCNHQLTKPQLAFDERGRVQWASAEAKCPECGSRSKRVPARGRKAWVRRLPWILVALPALLLIPWFVFLSLERYTPSVFSPIPTWPTADLEGLLGSLALQRERHPASVMSRQFWKIDPATGEVLFRYESVCVLPNVLPPFVSPSGAFLVATGDRPDQIVVVETATGQHRAVEHLDKKIGHIGYLGLSRFLDGDRALVQRQTVGGVQVECTIDLLDLPSGKLESITSMQVPAVPDARYIRNEFLATNIGNRWVWLLRSSVDSHGVRPDVTVRWVGADGRQLEHRPWPVTDDIRLSADGTAFLIDNGEIGSYAVELSTGNKIERPREDFPATYTSESPLAVTETASGQLAISDDSTSPFTKYAISASGLPFQNFPAISQAARLVASGGTREVPSRWHQILTGKPTRLEGEIRIFRIPDPPTE